jgi:hypothetical protein
MEAAGIEPLLPVNPNPMMANDFSFYNMRNHELLRRFFSPEVHPSPGDILRRKFSYPFNEIAIQQD